MDSLVLVDERRAVSVTYCGWWADPPAKVEHDRGGYLPRDFVGLTPEGERPMANDPAQSGTPSNHPTAPIEYGRSVLHQHMFWGREPSGIEPGTFIRLGQLPFQVVLVTEIDSKYIGIALDRPTPGKMDIPQGETPKDYAESLGPEYYASLDLSDHNFGSQLGTGVGTWGTYARVPSRTTRIGIEMADRCWDLSAVLTRLLDRFHADLKHEKTGYLADCESDTGVFWTNDMSTLLRCVAPPINAAQVVGATGVMYSSHFKHRNHPLDAARTPQGWCGALTLVGQIACIAGVLKDRLEEMVKSARHDATIAAIDRLVGRQGHPIRWNDDEREDLARVRSELLRARQWMAATPADPAPPEIHQPSTTGTRLASTAEPSIDELDESASREREFELGRRELMEYQSRAQELARQSEPIAKMIRESTEPFLDLVIRRGKAEAAHGKAVGRWHHRGSHPRRMPKGHEIPNPESNDPQELRKFAESDYRTICLFRIGRLASTDLVQPLLASPKRRRSPIDRMHVHVAWEVKVGLTRDEKPMLDPRHFPPPLAMQMLEFVETLVTPAEHGKPSGEPQSGANVQKNQDSQNQFAGATPTGDFRPATWFRKGMAARLRMAAHKSRKTKRVATQLIDGVVCYSVSDARRWWPKDVPDDTKNA